MFEDGQEIKRSGYLKGTPMNTWRNAFIFGIMMFGGTVAYSIYLWIDQDRLKQKLSAREEARKEMKEREAMLFRRRELLLAAKDAGKYREKNHEKRISHKKATAKLSLQKRSKEEVKVQVKEVLEGGAGSVNLNETLEFKKCVKKDAEIKGISGELRDKFTYSKRIAISSDRISEENTGNEPAWSGKEMDDQKMFCQICQKDLSHMNSQRKSQHFNKCMDKIEQEQKEGERQQRLLEKAKTAVLDCPFCGKPFKSEHSRSSHLKKCAAETGVSTDQMLLLVKKQEEERQISVAAGIIPNMSRSLRQKQSSSTESNVPRKKRIKEPKSQFDEDVQMAMAISSSLAEEKQLQDLDQISITGSAFSSSVRETKKSRQKKQEDGEPLLLALSEEEKKKRLSNRVTVLILSQSSQEIEEFDCTPVLKESILGKINRMGNQFRSDDQEGKEVPGLWTRSILSEKFTANKAVFYVRSLMPPIEISKASAGSRFRYLSKSPGKCRSVDQEKGALLLDSAEPPYAITSADYDNINDTIIASTQTAVILAELAGDEDVGGKQKDEEESKGSQKSQHSIQNSKLFDDHIKNNDETEKFSDSEGLQASGFCHEELVSPKEDDALVLQQQLHTDLLGLVNNPNYSDMNIITKDKQRLHTHRVLLMARCPVLLQMCADNTVVLEESREEVVLALLTYLYTGQLSLSPHILPQLVTLAHRLELHELLKVCNQMEVSQHTKNTEGDACDDSYEHRSQGLQEVWGESNTDSEDRNSEISNNQDDDGDKENDFISIEDYQEIMCTQRKKIGSRTIYESNTLEQSEMKDGLGTSKGSEKKERKNYNNQSDVTTGSRNFIKTEKREHENNSSKSGISTERHSQSSSTEVYIKTDKTIVNTNVRSRICWLRDKEKFIKGSCDLTNSGNTSIPIEHEDISKRKSAVVIKNDLEGDMENTTTDHVCNSKSDKEMKSQSFQQQGELGLEEDEVSIQSSFPISVGMELSDIIVIQHDIVKDNSPNISFSKSPSKGRKVRNTKGRYRDGVTSSSGQVNDNHHNNHSFYVECPDVKDVSIVDVGTSTEATSLVNTVNCNVEEHLEKGNKCIIDNGASSASASPVISRRSNSLEKSTNNNTSIQTPEKELDISSDLFSSPTPVKAKKAKSKELSPFRNSFIDERKISTSVRDTDTDVRKVETNQNISEMSPFIGNDSRNRKIEIYSTDGVDKTLKRAASDTNSSHRKRSKKDISSTEEEDLNYAKLKVDEQNDGDVEIVGDNFSEMCAQSPTFKDRRKSKWISKDKISDVSISSNQDHFIGKLTDDIDIDTEVKSFELEESVMEDSRFKKDQQAVRSLIHSCEGQIDVQDCPSLYIPTEKSTMKTNNSQNATGSLQPVLDILADPNIWEDFDDCGAGFGDGVIVFTPLKSASQKNDAKCSQSQSTRKSSITENKRLEVLQHDKTQPTDDNDKNNISARGHNTDINNLKGDNLEDSLVNRIEDEAVFADDSFIWMMDNMPVDKSNPEMKEETSPSDKQYKKAVNFKTPESASREKKARKEWMPPSPFTPMPDYVNMSTPLLKKEIGRYGVKPLSKKRMLLMLQDIYHKTHQYETDSELDADNTDAVNSATQDENCPSSSQESDISEVIEESFMEEKCTENDVPSSPQKCGENLTQILMKFIQDHPEIHIRMLMYEPLELDWLKKQMLDAGIKCSVDKLMNFLDEKCITFTMKSQRKDSRRGRGKKRRAKTSKESP